MSDEEYMREALRLAEYGCGRTSPNPMVGAVIVRDGRIVGAGWHRRAGTEHAEVHALRMAGGLSRGATLYVTLEPCSHTGRTGPCAKAVIEAGISRVVIAMKDPNPLVSGNGIKMMKAAGTDVAVGVLQGEAQRLNKVFVKWITERRPFVTLKMAMSLDGKIATASGESQWITGEEARRFGHRLRDESDGILVGIGTVIADNPSLTARLPGVEGRNPVRIVLDSDARIPLSSRMLHDGKAPVYIAVTESAPKEKLDELKGLGAEIIVSGRGPQVDLPLLMKLLGERGICSLLVEGGGSVHFSMLEQRLSDKILAFIAPKLIGGRDALTAVEGEGFKKLSEAAELFDIKAEKLGEDIFVTGYVRK